MTTVPATFGTRTITPEPDSSIGLPLVVPVVAAGGFTASTATTHGPILLMTDWNFSFSASGGSATGAGGNGSVWAVAVPGCRTDSITAPPRNAHTPQVATRPSCLTMTTP